MLPHTMASAQLGSRAAPGRATPLQGIAFALLVAATVGALLVTQHLKSAPPLIEHTRITGRFSPGTPGAAPARISFRLAHADRITVTVVRVGDHARVKRLVTARRLPAHRGIVLRWDGRTDAGRRARPGRYDVQVRLARQGRTAILPKTTHLRSGPAPSR